MLEKLRVYNQVNGWKCYDINGTSSKDLTKIINELYELYNDVDLSHFGTYLSSDLNYGYIACK